MMLFQVGIKAEFDRSSIQSISPGASAILQLHQQQQNQQQQQQLFGENRTHYQLPEVNSPPNRERTSLKNWSVLLLLSLLRVMNVVKTLI